MNQFPGNGNVSGKTSSARRIAAVVPIIGWLPGYRAEWLWQDLVAGLTLAAYAVPVAMAYASLAGLAPQVGIYCYIFGGIVYAIFASSRHLAIGPTAAISVMVASEAGKMAGGDVKLYAAVAAMTAGVVALISIAAWLFRLSIFVNFISETILLGFMAGAALNIASTQLPKLFGVSGGGDNFFQRMTIFFRHLGETNPVVLLLGVGALLLLLAGDRLFPGRPIALLVVMLSIAVVSLFGLAGHGVRVVGLIPGGLPAPTFPEVGGRYAGGLLELGFACFLLSYIESISTARILAQKHRYPVDARQELLGLGIANIAAALGQGYPVGGGLSQSAVNEQAGARTPLSIVGASIALAVALSFLAGLLRNLPEAVLAAIVIAAVSGFVKIRDFRRLLEVSRVEFHVGVVAFAGVLLFGMLNGVMISAVISILMVLRSMADPHVATLGRIPGSRRFSDVERHPDNELVPGIFMFRVEAALLYFNVENVDKTVLERVHASDAPVRVVICDLSTSPYIDMSGARMLARLQRQLAYEGIIFRVAEPHAEARDILRKMNIDERLGGVSRFMSLADIVKECQEQ
jgi:SulP family sulfate permease